MRGLGGYLEKGCLRGRLEAKGGRGGRKEARGGGGGVAVHGCVGLLALRDRVPLASSFCWVWVKYVLL